MGAEERVSLISTFRNEASPGLRVVADDVDAVGRAADDAAARSKRLEDALRLPTLEDTGVDAFVAQQAMLSGSTSEVIEKLIAEASELRNDAEAKAENQAALDSLLASMDTAPESVQALEEQFKALRDTEKQTAESTGMLGNISLGQAAKFVGLGLSIEGARRAVMGFTNEALEDEVLQNRLSIAVGRHTRDVNKYVDALNDQASAVSAVTGYERDAVTAGQAYAMSLGLTIEQTMGAVDAAIELSAVTGHDLQSSIQKVAWSYNGFTREIGRLIPQIKDLTKEELAAGKAADLIKEKLGGAAEGAGGTVKARISALKDEFRELGENIGQSIEAAAGGEGRIDEMLESWRLGLKAVNDRYDQILNVLSAINKVNPLLQNRDPGAVAEDEPSPGAQYPGRFNQRTTYDVSDAFPGGEADEMKRLTEAQRKTREFYDVFVEEMTPAAALEMAQQFTAAGKGAEDVAKVLQAIADSKAADEFMQSVERSAGFIAKYPSSNDAKRETPWGKYWRPEYDNPLSGFKFDTPQSDPLGGKSPADIVEEELALADAEWKRGLDEFGADIARTFGHTLATTRDWGTAFEALWDSILASIIDKASEDVGGWIGDFAMSFLTSPSGQKAGVKGGTGTDSTRPGYGERSGLSQQSTTDALIGEFRALANVIASIPGAPVLIDGRVAGRTLLPHIMEAQARGQ